MTSIQQLIHSHLIETTDMLKTVMKQCLDFIETDNEHINNMKQMLVIHTEQLKQIKHTQCMKIDKSISDDLAKINDFTSQRCVEQLERAYDKIIIDMRMDICDLINYNNIITKAIMKNENSEQLNHVIQYVNESGSIQ